MCAWSSSLLQINEWGRSSKQQKTEGECCCLLIWFNVTVFAERLVCLLCWTFVSLGVRVCWWRSQLCVGTARWRKHNNRLCKEVELWSKEKEKSKRSERRWDDFTLLLVFVYCMVTSSCRINHSLIYMYEVLMLVLPGEWFTLVPVALGLVAMLLFSFWHLDCKDSPTWCKLQCLLYFTGRRKVSKLLIWCCAYDSAALESYTYYHPPRPLSCIFLSQWNISSTETEVSIHDLSRVFYHAVEVVSDFCFT